MQPREPTKTNVADYLLTDSTKVALLSANNTLTHRELKSRVKTVAGWLTTLDIKPGSALALLGKNSFDFVTFYLATIWAGFT